MKFDSKYYRELAEQNFEEAWIKSGEVLTEREPNKRYPLYGYKVGEEHPLFKTIQEIRKAYLNIGFKEVVNPLIIEDIHVKKQFGKEALAVLDRCFYLSSLPKPNVGISSEKIRKIKNIIEKDFDVDNLKEILHQYKKGKIDGDDLSYEIAKVLKISDVLAIRVIDEVFPEFKDLKPESSNLTLRSHMTAGWFITLSKIAGKIPPPIKLFSVDRCFRKEQGEDATRLYTYFSASCVIMDEDVGVDDGKAVAEALLRQFGFKKFKFKLDDKRSKYYIPNTQTEVFAYHPKLVGSNTKYSEGWIEIATFGIYSPIALSNYNIEYPVMNLGMGVERLAMVLYNYSDIRELVYPQLYDGFKLSDLDIARAMSIVEVPKTSVGFEIARSIIKTAEKYANVKSPCSFKVWEGKIYGRNVRVQIFEKEDNTKLCGPASFNEIVIYEGNIYGIPKTNKWKEYFENGVSTGIRYIDGFAYKAASFVEECSAKAESGEVRVRVVESLSDINVSLHDNVRRYIASKGNKIDVRGPMFVAVGVEVE